jgi:hypothetical protein
MARTLNEEIEFVVNNIESQANIQDSDQTIIAQGYAFGGFNYLLGRFIADIQKNVSPENAYSEKDGGSLEVFGRFVLGRDPIPATQGQYQVTVTGSDGGTVVAGTQLRDDGNNLFEVETTVVISGTSGVVDVVSLTAGTSAKLSAGQILFFTGPIDLINSEAEVLSVTTEPFDDESLEDYRAKIKSRELAQRSGGSPADFRNWSFDVAGVRNSYIYLILPNICNFYIEADTNDFIASQALLDAVEEVVEFNPDTTLPDSQRGRRPITTFQVNYISVAPLNVDIELVNLKDSSDIPAVTEALKTVLLTVRPRVDGADDPNEKNDVLSLGQLNCAAQNALSSGNSFDDLVMKVENTVYTTFRFLVDKVPFLNSVVAV